MACRKCLHQVEKGGDLTIEGTDREEKATGEGTSLSLEQNGSKLQRNLGLQREAFCFCCNGNALATTLIC